MALAEPVPVLSSPKCGQHVPVDRSPKDRVHVYVKRSSSLHPVIVAVQLSRSSTRHRCHGWI
jgi:hypothetical protein